MNQKLYVGGLNAATNDARLREVFSEYGEITEAKVITHRDTGASRIRLRHLHRRSVRGEGHQREERHRARRQHDHRQRRAAPRGVRSRPLGR